MNPGRVLAGQGAMAAGLKPFSRESRLRTRRQYAHVWDHSRSFVGRYCVLRTAPATDQHLRLGIVVSRRHSRKAVERNRSRRLLREAYRRLHPALAPVWMILIPRRAIKKARMQDVLRELRSLCREAGILDEQAG